MDQICPFEVVCWFSRDVRHLEFVGPEDTGFKVKKRQLRMGKVCALLIGAHFESHGSFFFTGIRTKEKKRHHC